LYINVPIIQGGRPSCDEPEAHAILDRYAALGGNFIDTADMYQFGESEEIIGKWLAR
jgi:aryl-alcohol dehydrogenase-like predicted oxidoreductase